MDAPRNKDLDYEYAADQLIAVLAAVAQRPSRVRPAGPGTPPPRPASAAVLSRLVFGPQCFHWQHETRRRRIRDTVVVARQRLARDQAAAQICANGAGYWLSASPATLASYVSRRRRQGLAHLAAAAHDIKPSLAPAAGQSSLFPPPSESPDLFPLRSKFRH